MIEDGYDKRANIAFSPNEFYSFITINFNCFKNNLMLGENAMRWTDESNEKLRILYSIGEHPIEDIAGIFNISIATIHSQANRLKLKRNPICLKRQYQLNSKSLINWVSRNGAWNKKEKIKRVCKTCDRIFYEFPYKINQSKGFYCSIKCYKIARHNPDTPLLKAERESREYKNWLKKVFERDGYICQNCGKGGYLEAHHILGFKEHAQSRFDVSNGITLCRKCHFKAHGKRLINSKKLPKTLLHDNPMITCGCGCGEQLKKYDSKCRERKFKVGHSTRVRYGNMPALR